MTEMTEKEYEDALLRTILKTLMYEDDRELVRRKWNNADRLAAIERDVRELVDKWRKETHGCCGCADELEAIIDAPDAGGEG